jgi:hypothetical protein
VKPAERGVLKALMHCMEILGIRQRLVFGCEVSRKRIVGPLFFEETIIAENYSDLLNKFIALLQQIQRVCWFQQDWSAAHTADTTAAFW